MERELRSRTAHRCGCRQGGASIVEAVIALPILLVVILGAIQFGLVYEAKATLNHASLQAARLGAVRNASPDAMRQGLARGLLPLYSPDSSFTGVARTLTRIQTDLASDTRIRILNPTREAFGDFGVEREGEPEIPNDRLHTRSTAVGAQSGLNIQDANLLKVQITYGYELRVPLVNWFIARVLLGVRRNADPFEQQLLRRTRIPIVATSTVRMQSPARLSDAVMARSDFPALQRIPADSAPPSEREESEPDDDEHSNESPGDGNTIDSPDGEEGQDGGSGLDEGFFGFGEGVGNVGGGGSGSNGEGTGNGGGVNGGNPQACAVEGPSPSPLPSDSASGLDRPAVPSLDSRASGSGATLGVALGALSVGNPIHVVTGNKYQVETDIEPLPGALALEFRRHYNSAAVSERSVLGAGWRHSYEAQLRDRGDGSITVAQADGRLIAFTKNAQTLRLDAQRANDGFVTTVSNGFQWHWPSGRELDFDADGRLVRVREQNELLHLRYDGAGSLISIVDAQRRELRFDYYANGRIATLRGPGKLAFRYVYDDAGNLEQAVATDGIARRYEYADVRHPHHLTGISVGSVKPNDYGRRNVFERVATWAYDERGRAVFSSHPNDVGKVTLMFGDGFTDVVDAFGRNTRYVTGWRDGVAFVSEVRGPGCGSCGQADAHFVYDDHFHATEVGAKHGPTFRYHYDELGRLREIDRTRDGRMEWMSRYVYDGQAMRPVRIERPSVRPGAVAALDLDYEGERLQSMTERGFTLEAEHYRPIVRTTSFVYDAQGRLSRMDGPRIDVDDWTYFEYDERGRLTALKSAASETRILERDASGRPTRLARAGRPLIELEYDSRGRMTAVVEVRERGARKTSYEYDALGRPARVTDPFGRVRHVRFDAAGRPNRSTSSDSEVTAVARYAPDDGIERIVALARNGTLLRTLYYAYDTERRLAEIRDGSGQPLQRFSYVDADALPDRMTDPFGGQTWFGYDAFGQLESVLAPDGGFTQYERDRAGRLTSIIAPNDAATRYRYDDFGRRVTEISSDRGTTSYRYDAANNLIAKTDARGSTTTLRYDAANRLVRVERAEGTSTLGYVHGLLVAVDGEQASERYAYDADAQLIAHTRIVGGQSFTSRYAYDDLGRLVTRDLPSGARLRYRYGDSDAVQSISRERWLGDRAIVAAVSSEGHRKTAKLDALGQFVFGNGLETRTSFEPLHGHLHRRQIEGVAKLDYEHDEAGRLTALSQDDARRTFEHDALGRLNRARTSPGDFEYSYDANGNRVSVTEKLTRMASRDIVQTLSDATAYGYAAGSNRLTSTTGNVRREYDYDAAGNPLRIGRQRFEYDTSGRMTKLFADDHLLAEYRYNFWGERIQKIVHTNASKRHVTTFIYDQQKLLAEADERGNVIREYIYVDDHPVALLDRGKTFWIHTDHLGTPLAVSDQQRTIVWRAEHDPFGAALVTADPDRDRRPFTLNIRFPGQYADAESGLHYNYFRDYDPSAGRYLTPDPLGSVGGTNPFAYVHNDPSMRTDTLGLYDQMVHYYMTYFLGLVAGLPQDVARTIAIASQYVDENYLTQPIRDPLIPNRTALPLYHFVMDYGRGSYGDSNANRYLRFQNPSSTQLTNLFASTDPTRLRALWVQTHPTGTPGLCPMPSYVDINNARYQLYGEYLHAFQDTFAHRDAFNMPYAIDGNDANTPGAWIGHAGVGVPDDFGHAPDRTYNQNYRSPSRCTVPAGARAIVVENLSESECTARGGSGYVAANDADTSECEVRYALGGHPVTQGVTEAECAALGRQPGAVGSTYRPGSGQIWAFNELRTLRMEYEVFGRIQQTFGDEIARNRASGAPTFGWSDIAGLNAWDQGNPANNARIGSELGFEEWAEGRGPTGPGSRLNASIVLQQFNASRGSEVERLGILNDWLSESGIQSRAGTPIEIEEWGSVRSRGAGDRNENVGWLPDGALDGVLLPQHCQGRGCPR